jgi:hypothetical protein
MKSNVEFKNGNILLNGITYSKWCYFAENIKKLQSPEWIMAPKRSIFLQLDDENQSIVEIVKHELMCMVADIKKNGMEKYQKPGYCLLALVDEDQNYLLLVQSQIQGV